MKNIILLLTVILFTSCKPHNYLPNYPVRLEINIMANAPELAVFNGFKEFVKPANSSQFLGFGGVLIFHSIDDKFYAFDMACPYESKSDVRVHCSNLGIAVCEGCKTRFYVADGLGFVQNGKSKNPLKKYSVYYYAERQNIIVVN